jgi:hypothetical protein
MLTDKLAWELFGLAGKERMLFSRSSEGAPTPRGGAVSQRALSFLTLFDRIIIHDFSPEAGACAVARQPRPCGSGMKNSLLGVGAS